MLEEVRRTEAMPHVPAITQDEAEATARAAINLFSKWQISDAEARKILGDLPQRTFARWKAGQIGRIDRDLATRLSLLMGIHKGLRHLFSDHQRGYAWVKRPNEVFNGRTPLEIMCEGDMFALARVRTWLDSERGGW